jgi:hypothetical protein
VCTVWKHGVYGIIELKRDAVNLKAPDRKSFVHDEKYRDFKKWLDEDCKLLYISFVQQATDAQFEEYEGRIDEILDPKDYADYLPAYDELKYEQSRIKILVQEVPNSRTVEDLAKSDEKIEKQTQVIRSAGSYASYTPEKVEVKPEFVRKKGEMKKRLGKVLNIVWCEFSRKEELTELITKAESAGIKVQFSKGKLYGKAFEFWGIPHIEEIMDKTEAKYIIGRVIGSKNSDDGNYRESTKKEERLLNVLQRIESYYGIEDVFRIADVKEHLSIEHNGEKVIDSVTKATAAPIKDRKKIYLDRSSLNLGKVSISESRSAITKFDVLIVMLNISTIASGLAQLIYNTIDQTVDHYAKVDKISKEIALLMASL